MGLFMNWSSEPEVSLSASEAAKSKSPTQIIWLITSLAIDCRREAESGEAYFVICMNINIYSLTLSEFGEFVLLQADSRRCSGWWWWWEWRQCCCTTSLSWPRNISVIRSASNWASIINKSWLFLQSPSAIWVPWRSHLSKPHKRLNAEENDRQVGKRLYCSDIPRLLLLL